MIKVFTPSFADEADNNAQNLSVKEIVARLDPDGFQVTMLHEAVADVRIRSRPNTRLLKWRAHGNTVRTLGDILANRPDVYFFPREGPLDAAFLKLRRYLGFKTALVSYVVSGGLDSGAFPPARVQLIREADVVFDNNLYVGQLLREKMGVVSGGTMHDGIDRRHFYPPVEGREGRTGITVLFAGSFRPYKRAPLVLRQAARWPNVQFRVAGRGEEEQICKNLADQLGCKNVLFLGHLSQSQIGEEMRRADIFFFPSILEGHPQVLLQAAGSALPIIAMRVYRPDCVLDGKTGFLADSDDDLSRRLDLLILNPDLRRSMGNSAAEYAIEFDWDTIAAKWARAFEQVVARRRKRDFSKSVAS
jgi:glycosyltransferase involved in cell wall biosynthesis